MWSIVKPITGITNTVIIPTDGMITVSKPDNIQVLAYVDGNLTTPVDRFWGPAGKPVYFEIKDAPGVAGTVTIMYGDTVSNIEVPFAIESTGTNYFDNETRKKKMAEILNPAGMMMSGGGDGGLGFGSGGGLIGGLILGSLLRQGGGGLFGGNGSGDGAASAVTGQATANMQLMQSIGQVDKSVAVNAASFEASQAQQSLGLTNQFNNVTSSLATRIDAAKEATNATAMLLSQQLNQVNTNILTGFNNTERAITADGTTTRALIVSQYEQSLNRQLTDANAEIIELRGDGRLQAATAGINVTTTNNINQMQQQAQQQQQYASLANLIYGLGQNITNGAINVGSGTLTANPTNTNTSIR
ncbi:extracellular solute-binding protein [bacterium]|nr:extracellular solute-binding protein [bacterium]